MHRTLLSVVVFTLTSAGGAQSIKTTVATGAVELRQFADTNHAHIVGRAVTAHQEQGRTVLSFDSRPGAGFSRIPGLSFTNGDIEFDVRGRDSVQGSFVGVAFHIASDSLLDLVYLRPFNFRATDSTRHAHAVQYTSEPAFPWQRLRAEHPGVYEKAIVPEPDPTAWVHVKLSVHGPQIRVYINGARTPALEVTALGAHTGDGFGLFVGTDSPGDFASLRITPAK